MTGVDARDGNAGKGVYPQGKAAGFESRTRAQQFAQNQCLGSDGAYTDADEANTRKCNRMGWPVSEAASCGMRCHGRHCTTMGAEVGIGGWGCTSSTLCSTPSTSLYTQGCCTCRVFALHYMEKTPTEPEKTGRVTASEI